MSKHLHFDAQVLKILFSFISSQYVLKRNASIAPECFDIPSKELLDTLHTKLNQYHSPELKRGLDELCEELNKTDSLPVFPLIFRFADSMIGRYNEKFHFSYKHCDVWRDVTMEMDEEYLVVAKAVMEDCKRQITSRSTFSWSYCIEHDNYRLSRMLCRDQGVSDNHFHDHITCRSQHLREIIEQQADGILSMREFYQEEATRIHGIDACSNEMHCRPEVFGPVFRLLQFYERPVPKSKLRQLQATYHVGEDNYDIVDGLRAIHEAILFLGLRSGSRLGHATMLGMPPKYYYEQKKKTITMPRQYFLDNVVWMYYFIQNNFIVFPGVANMLNYLKDKFLESFFYVYEELDAKTSSCDIYVYYLSWLLRGDAPELYRNRKFEMSKDDMERHKICQSDDEMETARKHQGACQLYYRYHYDAKVKQRGMLPVTETVSDLFVETVEILQKEMQRQISMKGIAIETNPSSNVLISMLPDYSQHPITTFFDRGISDTPNFHQLNVSINTDDKSVFSTSISNEYAYLAFYLENAKNSEGQFIYSRYEIFEWLDAIRKSGNEQAFDEIGF